MTYDAERPETWPRRVLLAVTGLTPQVVTESLYALAVASVPHWVPTEICLVTTAEGAERARLALLSEHPGWFARLRRDYRLPEIRFDSSSIRVLSDANGQPLTDIRSRADNDLAADFIAEEVRRITADADCALHVSLAGGRKTLGFYAGFALSLYGRPQDRLSHVLVSEPYESSWEFFYPTPYERIITTRDNKLADCAKAEVNLADIAFVRLREELPPRLRDGRVSFIQAVAAANRALAAPRLELEVRAQRVLADGQAIELGPTEFALLLFFAERVRSEEPEVEWSADAAREFLGCARRVLGSGGGEYERCEKAVKACRDDAELLANYFQPQKSRLNSAFREALGKSAAGRYEIERTGPKGQSRYRLPLAVDQVEIRS